ncbi:hypothetical protein BDV33DRAFT_210182 [Aspergillus novoparasiticus]|uniref:Carboxylesterase type B domain-containing protein n=1 Tax=Aspergillus novoparasiticus TaxID=986946 RepID=A0A5N6E8P9_9EURO|nr:hypothetical protein BDV33DRAFT_210182 [Aspergillus novoparasiticus]
MDKSNDDEGRTFVESLNRIAPLFMLFGGPKSDLWQEILNARPIGAPGIATQADRMRNIITDLQSGCTLYAKPVAYYSSEINMIFGTFPQVNATVAQRELNQIMQKAWAGFAKAPYYGPGWATVPTVGLLSNGKKVAGNAVLRVINDR